MSYVSPIRVGRHRGRTTPIVRCRIFAPAAYRAFVARRAALLAASHAAAAAAWWVTVR